MPPHIHLDVETFSLLNVSKVGAYRYAEDPSTQVLIACYAIGAAPVRTWLPYKNPKPPADLMQAVEEGACIVAHNVEFERQIWLNVLRLPELPRQRWRCTAARAATAGLPRSLGGALKALGGVVQKDTRGGRLIRLFCMPRKPTKKDASVRVMPEDRPEDFADFVEYCRRDVVGERRLDKALPDLSAQEWRHFHYNMRINDRGIPLDLKMIDKSARVVAELERQNNTRTAELTRTDELPQGLKATQTAKVMEWIRQNGSSLPNMQKKTIDEIMLAVRLPPKVEELLTLRLEASKASTKKIKAMATVACKSGNAHGTMLFYGAHTGRNSGKLIQPHNFTRGLLTTEQQLRVLEAFSTGDTEWVLLLFGGEKRYLVMPDGARLPFSGPMDLLSQAMRGFLCAPDGRRFVIADYSAIETRILAWWANEVKLLAIYHRNLTLPKAQQVDVYKLMASVVYQKAYALIDKEERRIGKNLRLGAGFQLGVDGLIRNAVEKEGIEMDRELAERCIKAYRDDNPNIVRLWYATEEAALMAVDNKGHTYPVRDKVQYEHWKDWLVAELPSGRKMYYYKPEINTVIKFKRPKRVLSYFEEQKKAIAQGVTFGDMPDRNNRMQTYGGKLVENAVQAIARDIMFHGMLSAEAVGYPTLANIHDEIVTLRKYGEGTVHELEKVICSPAPWSKGLPLVAEGFECVHYRKG